MAESPTKLEEEVKETVVEQPPELNPNGAPPPTPEELVAKCIAPVKPNFLRPRPPRQSSRNDDVVAGQSPKDRSSSTVVAEKKSKRQLKRERLQEKKSAAHICPGIAKTGDVSSCPYGEKCRFSHDLEAYKAQKPEDLDGECPFFSSQGSCQYGISCRFYGTHKASDGSSNVPNVTAEINGLKSDVRKLLWKSKMKFPKADGVLVSLGLANKESLYSKSKEKGEKENFEGVVDDSHTANGNGCGDMANDSADRVECSVEVPFKGNEDSALANDSADRVECSVEVPFKGNEDSALASDEVRPLKKAKSDAEECCSGDEANGSSALEKENNFKDCCQEAERKIITTVSEPEAKIITIDSIVTETDRSLKLHPREKKLIDFREKLYLAPLTTVGNLPFRRVCKVLGADITCGEMAMCTNLLQGQASEWALLRRHSSEDLFGVQICGAFPDTVARTLELIDQECTVDFIDINMGCPIDIVVNKGAGSALLTKPMRMKSIIEAASATVEKPITIKVRTGYFEGKNRIDSLIADIGNWGASAVTIHGRTRQQRYSKLADWDYVYQCARKAPDSLPVLGNGDIFSYMDWNTHKVDCPELSSCMIARGALIKPWIFTEIKEQRHWDISSGERLDILKKFARYGLEHWGSDTKGVETTRHFLLEWLSYTFRYIPVGLLDVIPQRLNWRPPAYYGRDDLETLMASDSAADWIRISEMLLGKVPEGFTFAPKHKSNAYDVAENG